MVHSHETFTEDQLLPISALQHLVFCPRQWGLMYLERLWQENLFTSEGALLHEKAHDGSSELQGELLVARGVWLRSLELGLVGVADVVEFRPAHKDEGGVALPGREGLWLPRPVEYKRGRPKPDDCDKIQLCAQALCLEEMLKAAIPEGDIFYGQPRRRQRVPFDAELRRRTRELAARLHELTRAGRTPPARWRPSCRSCSLLELCLPRACGEKSARRYLASNLGRILRKEEPS